MVCSEARDYLFAFLDNELEPGLSIQVQRHIEQCCDCGRDAEIERTVRRELILKFERIPQPRFDEAGLRRMIRPVRERQAARDLLSMWRSYFYAAGQALVLLAGLAAGVRFSTGRGKRPGNSFADLLVAGHELVARRGEPVELESADPAQVASWIRQQRDWSVTLSPPSDSRHRLVGARLCVLSGRSAAQVLYDVKGAPVSLLILPNEPADLREMLPSNNTGILAHHFQGHTIVARRHGGMTYAAIGRTSPDQLTNLLPPAPA